MNLATTEMNSEASITENITIHRKVTITERTRLGFDSS